MTKSLIFVFLSTAPIGHLAGQPLPTAEEVLTHVANNYSKVKRVLIKGDVTFERPGLDGLRSSPFLFAYELPDKFHIDGVPSVFGLEGEFSDRWIWVGDGEMAWTYDLSSNTYKKTPKSSLPKWVATFEGGHPALERPEQVVASLKMSTPGWLPGALEKHRLATITGSESLSIKSKSIECFRVQSEDEGFAKKSDGATQETLWIDKQRFVVWRREALTWLTNGAQYRARFELTTVKLDEPLPHGIFTFRPPKHSKLVP